MGVLRNTGRTTQFNGPQTVLDKGQITGYAGSQATTQPQQKQPDVSLRTFEPMSWSGSNYSTQPTAQQGSPAGMGDLNKIFQSLLPMVMNGGLLAPQQNQGQRALNAVNSAGAFNQAQYNQQMNSMQDATARLGNLSRFGQPSNTMPPSLPQSMLVNFNQMPQNNDSAMLKALKSQYPDLPDGVEPRAATADPAGFKKWMDEYRKQNQARTQQPNASLLPGSGPIQKFTGQSAVDLIKQNSGQAVNNMPAFAGPKISPEGPGFNPPRVPNTAPTMTSQQPAAYNPYQMRTNSAAPGSTVQISSQPVKPPTSAMSGPMTSAQQYNQSMNQLTPAQRQMQSQQMTMGQRSQAPANPWARKSLIR